ncbi:MAG: AP2 domain-containing protein [Clostridia bacterium]
MVVKIDRTGEESINNFGSKIVITKYNYARDINVYFPEYNWTAKNVEYRQFKNGEIKCPYERRTFGVGYMGEGKYKSKENGKITRVYKTWQSMLQRCYDKKYHEKEPTYINCEVDKKWHNFQNFAKWYEENYYTIEGERMHLDKDILVKHNKVYNPETCIFVPQTINLLFTKRNNARGESVIGTTLKNGKYKVQCHIIDPKTGKSKQEYLGYYGTQEKAFEVYKYYKEKYIKEVADYYKDQISEKLYNAMYNYEVEITD